MAIHHQALADDQGVRLPGRPVPTSLDAAANEARLVLNQLLGDIARLRSNVAAFKLSSQQEALTKGHALYWPDLLESLEALIPDGEPIERAVERLAQVLNRDASAR